MKTLFVSSIVLFLACCQNGRAQEDGITSAFAPVSVKVDKVILRDSFKGEEMNSKKWKIPTWYSSSDGTYVGRTQFRTSQNEPLPQTFAGRAYVALDTYNPTGYSIYGTDLIAKKKIHVGKGILVTVVADVKGNLPRGSVAGIFLYSLKSGSNTIHDEIDFELLGNVRKRFLTNIYAAAPLGVGRPRYRKFPKGNVNTTHKYQILWRPDVVSWFVDGKKVRTVRGESKIPKGPMYLHINMWAPDRSWEAAYDSSLAATRSPSENQEHILTVKYVRVEKLK